MDTPQQACAAEGYFASIAQVVHYEEARTQTRSES